MVITMRQVDRIWQSVLSNRPHECRLCHRTIPKNEVHMFADGWADCVVFRVSPQDWQGSAGYVMGKPNPFWRDPFVKES